MPRTPALIIPLLLLPLSAYAGELVTIGVSAPLTGPFAILGKQIAEGAEAARAALGADKIALVISDDRCDGTGGKEAADLLIAAKAVAAIGYLCTPALQGALPALRAGKLPVSTLSVRHERLLDDARKNGDALFRLGPGSDQEQTALAELLLPLWRAKNFAIIDDGTIHSRELAESLRLAAEARGLKPVFTDTFRPALENQISLVNRLKKAGATHVFIGGDRSDVAVIARDAEARGVKLTLAGGETLNAAPDDVPLADGVIMLAAPLPPAKNRPDDEGYFASAFAAVEIIAQAAAAGEGAALAQNIGGGAHPTLIGGIKFRPNGAQSGNPYRLLVSKAGVFEDFK